MEKTQGGEKENELEETMKDENKEGPGKEEISKEANVKEEKSNNKQEEIINVEYKGQRNRHLKENTKRNKKKHSETKAKGGPLKAVLILVIVVLILTLISFLIFFVYNKYSKKFKDVSIELGTDKVELSQFVADEKYMDSAKFVTDMSTIDFSKTGSYQIELSYGM